MNRKMFKYSIVAAVVSISASGVVSAETLEQRIQALEAQIGQMESLPGQGAGGTVELYGSLRSHLNYREVEQTGMQDDSETDIKDAVSRIGIRASNQIGDWTATARGEWKVHIGKGADFGDGRLAYIEMAHKAIGTAAIGQQWTGFYNHIGEIADIANTSSPAGYDALGASYRAGNMLTYKNVFGPLSIQVDGQFDGDTDRDSSDENDGRDNLDSYGVAASLKFDGVRLSAAYSDSKSNQGDSTEFVGVGASYSYQDFYLGTSYVQKDQPAGTYVGVGAVEPESIDVSAAYSMGKNKFIVHGYDYDSDAAGNLSTNLSGVQLTAQHQISDQLRVWAELDMREADGVVNADKTIDSRNKDQNILSLGVRYDFSVTN